MYRPFCRCSCVEFPRKGMIHTITKQCVHQVDREEDRLSTPPGTTKSSSPTAFISWEEDEIHPRCNHKTRLFFVSRHVDVVHRRNSHNPSSPLPPWFKPCFPSVACPIVMLSFSGSTKPSHPPQFRSDYPSVPYLLDHRYYIEEKDEPHLRTRVGMEASCRWEARHNFAAFDVPVPGSCALDVHYTIRSTDSLNPYPEQCRISLKARRVFFDDRQGRGVERYLFAACPHRCFYHPISYFYFAWCAQVLEHLHLPSFFFHVCRRPLHRLQPNDVL